MRLLHRIAATATVVAAVLVPLAAATPASAALPAVDMEKTVLAAQIDPSRSDDTQTPGAHDSVLRVERALRQEGLLDDRWVDGYFGTKTLDAYAAHQRSLGYRGLAANGLPGRASLAELGAGRFRVVHEIGPGSKVRTDEGVTINTRTRAMLQAAERALGRDLVLTQGSYNAGGDPTSAGTHDGGGALDIDAVDLSPQQRDDVARELRRVGFAAWVRTPSQGRWPFHVHAIATSDTDLSSAAQDQVADYYLGRNGLANNAADDGPQVPRTTWEDHLRQ